MISESDFLKAQKGRAKTKEIPTAFLQLNPTTQAILEVFEEFGDDLQLYSVCEPSATPLLSIFTTLAKNQQCFFSFSGEVTNDQNFIKKRNALETSSIFRQQFVKFCFAPVALESSTHSMTNIHQL